MSNPQNPNDPDSLSLVGGSSGKKADFSDVESNVSSTAETRKQADFSDVQSSVSSTADVVGEQSYTVQKGDTLSHISQHFYGKASHWNRIFEANRDQLDNPDRIKPGQVLKIPPQAD